MKRKLAILGTILPVVLALDVWTKRWALETLSHGGRELFGGLVPLTLAYNRGAAFGISVGDDPRWFFIPVTILAVCLLGFLFVQARNDDHLRLTSLTLVISGALGNLIDRVRWELGVVDFIGPVDLGFMHWPIFNVADMAISCGAVLLAVSFWIEERERASAPRPADGAASETRPDPASSS